MTHWMLLVIMLSAVAAANGMIQWNPWGSWSSCSAACGQGKMTRERLYPGQWFCSGSTQEESDCKISDCSVVNGGWSGWAGWSVCSHKCGGGKQTRERTCSNPPPTIIGKACKGSVQEQRSCNGQQCTAAAVEPITSITFDHRDAWQHDNMFSASNGVHLENRGVLAVTNRNCRCSKCGFFDDGSYVKLPYFSGMDFFKFSVSLWFMRTSSTSNVVILSTDKCGDSSIYIMSPQPTQLQVNVRTAPHNVKAFLFNTTDQYVAAIHVVIAFSASTVTGTGRVTVYVNGLQVGQQFTQGKIGPLKGNMLLGSGNCPLLNNFKGYIDSVSFAKHELSAAEVKLYQSHGNCFGESLDTCGPP